MQELRFDNRVAVISGAGGGLGREYALLLASRGAQVVVNDLGTSRHGEGADLRTAQTVVNDILAKGGIAVANGDSVATPEGGRAIIDAALTEYGRIDILIHNATINRAAPFRDLQYNDFFEILDVHLSGAFHLAKVAFPVMCDQGYGRIILTSSVAGLYGEKNISAYCAGKAAMMGLANALAHEGAEYGVTANCIVPCAQTRLAEGRDTDSYPPWGPEKVAPMIGWMAHESCKATGELFIALAGRMAKAWVAETRGVYQADWTLEEVAARQTEIENTSGALRIRPYPGGFGEHLATSFDMIRDAQ